MDELIPTTYKAYEIVKKLDPDDTHIFAYALAYPKSVIWSDDKKLKLQDRIRVMDTQEIIDDLL